MSRGDGCMAQPRPTFRESGWICHGTGLVTLMRYHNIPLVLPAELVEAELAAPWAKAYDPPVPFAGGDHYHLTFSGWRKQEDVTPIKAILWFGTMVYCLDHAGLYELKCVAVDEHTAQWLAWSLGRAHNVPVSKLDGIAPRRMSEAEMETIR